MEEQRFYSTTAAKTTHGFDVFAAVLGAFGISVLLTLITDGWRTHLSTQVRSICVVLDDTGSKRCVTRQQIEDFVRSLK